MILLFLTITAPKGPPLFSIIFSSESWMALRKNSLFLADIVKLIFWSKVNGECGNGNSKT
jgi:hypothetical protein